MIFPPDISYNLLILFNHRMQDAEANFILAGRNYVDRTAAVSVIFFPVNDLFVIVNFIIPLHFLMFIPLS